MNLSYLNLFLKIVEKGSLAAAGRELGLSSTTVSERLFALESHFGVTLLNRTTRAISLTEEGRMLVQGARNILVEAGDLENRIRLGAQTLSGLIRISAPSDFGRSTIMPVVDDLLSEHPALTIEMILDDGYTHIIDEGIDIAVRFGELQDSSYRVRTLGRHDRVVCASPDYLKTHGEPRTPSQLCQHNCLVMRFGAYMDNRWHFKENNSDRTVVVKGNRIGNDGELVHDWALSGHGIALKSRLDIKSDLKSGALVELLSDYLGLPTPLQLLFPPSRAQPRRVKYLSNKLADAFQQKTK